MQLTRAIAAFLTVLTFSALGQSPHTYVDLKTALGLTGAQLDELNRMKSQQEENRPRNMPLTVLTKEQRNKLAVVARVLSKRGGATWLIHLGVLSCGDWPEGCGCVCGGGDADKLFELDNAQRQRLEPTAAVKVPREAVIAILNGDQKALLSAFESDLRVVKEAIKIGLVPAPPLMGECLCN